MSCPSVHHILLNAIGSNRNTLMEILKTWQKHLLVLEDKLIKEVKGQGHDDLKYAPCSWTFDFTEPSWQNVLFFMLHCCLFNHLRFSSLSLLNQDKYFRLENSISPKILVRSILDYDVVQKISLVLHVRVR